jgi:hypothetical protein
VTGSRDFDDLCERLDLTQNLVAASFNTVLPSSPGKDEGETP